jgi:hypothetical protein
MEQTVNFTPELVSMIIGFILSTLFAYIPKLNVWFAGLVSKTKSLIMLLLLVLVSTVIYLLAYYGVIVTVQPVNIFTLLQVIFLTIMANQGTYLILPESAAVVQARLSRDERQ